ncbi:hypothetical protein Rhal01_01638 [Rubritalea halochordaticola]|uniref:N-acetylmuramoyl-L-alanine amidase n=1 Tax=Rubritalea halochordaticola TaxID=714537 RepID=A0ABP9UYZ3_9BACT
MNKSGRNLALEVPLIIFAIGVAFVVQMLMTPSKDPTVPHFAEVEKQEKDQEVMNVPVPKVDKEGEIPPLKIPLTYSEELSDLGEKPDWTELDPYQEAIRKDEFLYLLAEVFTVGDTWKNWITIGEDSAVIRTDNQDESQNYELFFQKEGESKKVPRYWRTREELADTPSDRPLAGLRIAIDPGHIGGNYAALEQRRFLLNENAAPVQEGDMTLTVANTLKDQLEALGAIVNLVREKTEPVNPFRVEQYQDYAYSKLEHNKGLSTQESVKREADRMFYRVGEIRARARLVNYAFKPDLVLCIHFNADAQPDPANPVLFEQEHFHMLLNGAYTAGEVEHEDERFIMILKILQGIHQEEAKLANAAATAFVREAGLPPYEYEPNSRRAVNVDGNPYLWARNLIANRLYECPVVYYEPYLMNGKDSYARMQMGDYDGLRYVNGQLRRSIYREYVDAVTEGLVEYYTENAK